MSSWQQYFFDFTMHHLCEPTDIKSYDDNSFWVCPMWSRNFHYNLQNISATRSALPSIYGYNCLFWYLTAMFYDDFIMHQKNLSDIFQITTYAFCCCKRSLDGRISNCTLSIHAKHFVMIRKMDSNRVSKQNEKHLHWCDDDYSEWTKNMLTSQHNRSSDSQRN